MTPILSTLPLGYGHDFTGKHFPQRQSCGAIEYQTPNPRFLMFHK